MLTSRKLKSHKNGESESGYQGKKKRKILVDSESLKPRGNLSLTIHVYMRKVWELRIKQLVDPNSPPRC